MELVKNCLVDLRHLCTIWHPFGITAGSMHHIELCYQQYENYHNNLQTEKTLFNQKLLSPKTKMIWNTHNSNVSLTIMITVKSSPEFVYK